MLVSDFLRRVSPQQLHHRIECESLRFDDQKVSARDQCETILATTSKSSESRGPVVAAITGDHHQEMMSFV